MYDLVFRISQLVKLLLQNFPISKSPIEMRIGPLLIEMDWSVHHLLNFFKQQDLSRKDLKQLLSVLYRDDEAIDPLMRAWIRASIWMDAQNLDEIKHRGEIYEMIRGELKAMVPYVESFFGKEESRFVIPPLFRSQKGDK